MGVAASEFRGGAEANARVTEGIKRLAVVGDGKGGMVYGYSRATSRSLSFRHLISNPVQQPWESHLALLELPVVRQSTLYYLIATYTTHHVERVL